MTVSAPPRPPEVDSSADPEALEALIEEARRRARRRRRLYGLTALVAGALGTATFFGFGDRDADPEVAAGETPRPGGAAAPAPRRVTARNGALTVLVNDGEREGIGAVLPSGGVRTLVHCRRAIPSGPDNPDRVCPAHPFSLDWSPDGRRLAYATAVGPGASGSELANIALHVLDTVSGEHLRRKLRCFAGDIDWAPDGSRLAYACDGWIRIVRSDLVHEPRLLQTAPGYYASPSWSPDGRGIAFTVARRGVASTTGPGIYIASTSARQRSAPVLVGNGWSPAWSPDGTRIAYRAPCNGIKLMTPAGGEATPVSSVRTCGIGVGGTPVWSPDGRKVAIAVRASSIQPGGGWPRQQCFLYETASSTKPVPRCVRPGVYVMNADGSGLRLATRELGTNIHGGGRPAWRPRVAVP